MVDPLRLWHYYPNVPAAIVATIVFCILTLYHTWRLFRTRTWFCIPFVIGGLFEIIGYAARAAGRNNMSKLMPYIIQSLLLLIAPPLFAASIYMILGRIMRATRAETDSIIRVNWVTKIFVSGDIACFLIQSAGGGIQATAKGNTSTMKLGQNIILAGLILQIVIFMFFLVVAGVFHSRVHKRPTPESLDASLGWEKLMWVLYAVSVLITVRNLIRVVEYGMGESGYLLMHEWTLYVFDGLLMAIVLLICTTWYSTNLRPRPKSLEAFPMEQQAYQPKISS